MSPSPTGGSATGQSLSALEALRSTPFRRYLAPDPIPEDVLWAILDAAIRGPSGGTELILEMAGQQPRTVSRPPPPDAVRVRPCAGPPRSPHPRTYSGRRPAARTVGVHRRLSTDGHGRAAPVACSGLT